ncbi:guanyl-specific ribonuclease [Parasphingorhabdus pacifica]
MTSRKRISIALIGLIALVVIGWFVRDAAVEQPPHGPAPGAAASGLPTRELSVLPSEVATTWSRIATDGPFPHPSKDGTVFENREEILPENTTGYYHEYTVPTPGSADRGARRLVTGGSAEVYYTENHYDSFVVVDVNG